MTQVRPLINTTGTRGNTAQKAVWLLIAVALNALETAIPRLPFLPWLKPGFANVITILWIIKFGCRDALLYTMLRIWISGFYFGFSLFTLSLSFCGGMLSTVAMSIVWLTIGKRGWIGTIGVAVVGAMFHNAGQLAAVYFMMARNVGLFAQVPVMIGASIIFGGIVGGIAPIVGRVVGFYDGGINNNRSFFFEDGGYPRNAPPKTKYPKSDMLKPLCRQKSPFGDFSTLKSTAGHRYINLIVVTLTFSTSILLMFIGNMRILAVAAIVFSVVSLILNPRKIFIVLYPLKFYILFLFIAVTHLFFSYGTRIDIIPFITKEGVLAFAKQSLRLWCWLQTIHVFKRFNFHNIFITILYKIFPQKADTLAAGMIALEHFPEIVRFAKSEKRIPIITILLNPKLHLITYIDTFSRRITNITHTAYGREGESRY